MSNPAKVAKLRSEDGQIDTILEDHARYWADMGDLQIDSPEPTPPTKQAIKALVTQAGEKAVINLANRIINVEKISEASQYNQLLDLRAYILESAMSYGWEIPEPYKSELAQLRSGE